MPSTEGEKLKFPVELEAPCHKTANMEGEAGGWRKMKGKTSSRRMSMKRKMDKMNVGLGAGAIVMSTSSGAIEKQEKEVRRQEESFVLTRFFTTLLASVMVFVVYLITLQTLMSVALSLGLTMFWYKKGDAEA